jgi:hypothetical protein
VKTANSIGRVSVAVAALTVSFALVWTIAGYAYPEMTDTWLAHLPAKVSFVAAPRLPVRFSLGELKLLAGLAALL